MIKFVYKKRNRYMYITSSQTDICSKASIKTIYSQYITYLIIQNKEFQTLKIKMNTITTY
jgi:hypothetical protein